jgi:DNA polymerase elongation subunit (family B)
MTAKILIVDIETAPNIAYVWGKFKQFISDKQWVDKTHIMSFSAKWLGEDGIIYVENRSSDDSNIVEALYELLDEADVVVAHNGRRFDLPTILGRGVVHGFTPPSPYRVVDTFDIARKELRLPSNSLYALCEDLDLPRKKDHAKFPGFELWLECLRGNDEAWKEMQEYNEQDVISLEALYLRLRPYARNHPNVVRDSTDVRCPKCGSDRIQYRGYYYTNAGLCYRRFVCLDCGGWGRVRFAEKDRTPEARNAT